jgi:hypothetical protein
MQQIHQHHQNTQANQSKNIKTESIWINTQDSSRYRKTNHDMICK